MKINIVFCINEAYALKAAVVMASVLRNNETHDIDFYILSSDLTQSSLARFKLLGCLHPRCSFNAVRVNLKQLQGFKLTIDYISIETYYRYFIADLLPNLDKVLYLDADLIVAGDLSELYGIDLGDDLAAGVEDLLIKRKGYNRQLKVERYFNAGVLLMNLRLMRELKLSHILVEKTIELQDKIQYQDQDILNVVCQSQVQFVDSIYNFTRQNIKREKLKRFRAKIFHFTGKRKPWNGRFSIRWEYYSRMVERIFRNQGHGQRKGIMSGVLLFFGSLIKGPKNSIKKK